NRKICFQIVSYLRNTVYTQERKKKRKNGRKNGRKNEKKKERMKKRKKEEKRKKTTNKEKRLTVFINKNLVFIYKFLYKRNLYFNLIFLYFIKFIFIFNYFLF